MLPAAANAQAEVARLSGKITSPQGLPVVGAEVVIGLGSRRAVSDSGGQFVVDNVLRGSTRVLARAIGFAPVDTVVIITAAEHAFALVMSRNVQVLPRVVTEAELPYGKPLRYQHTGRFDEFYERRAKRPGTFFTREDIERGGRNNVFELMSSVPGVVVGTRPGGVPYIRISRCVGNSIRVDGGPANAYRWLALYINGHRIRGAGGSDVLEYLSQLKAEDVETVEVYRGTTQLPMEAVGDACAAVFVTTRFTAGSVLPRR
ncbi:MAG TPA: carboxypeptidase regulatory-like domain-containing protein [Gemmatimonadaceae bacterium]|nr:carboxypeptidase regulatory-like domain-containing protein [Gemmatimonadaceae bacterium]